MASDNDDSVIKVTIAVNAIKEGKIGVPDEPWVQELLAAPRGPTGSVVLKGLSQGAISRARAVSMAVRFMQQQAREPNPEPVFKLDTAESQAELFRLFAILFAALVGVSAQDISYSDIQGRLLARLKDDGATVSKRVNAATDELHAFYKKNAHPLFQAAKEFGGMKAVLGGQRRFTETTLNGVRVSGLYLDTQLIPDPIFSFITSSIAKDMNAAPLQLAHTLFYLLQLEPLVHAHLATPLVFVFPSFDEGLEEHDAVTQAGLANLTYKVLAPACAGTVESYEEVEEYAKKQPDAFLQEVMKARLFVPQGGDVNRTYSWQDAVKLQLEELHGSVSEAYFETIAAMPPEQVVLIVECHGSLTQDFH